MINGVGFQEILLIGLLIFILFGSKGMGGVMRDLGRWSGKLKKYRDEFTGEIMKASEVQRTPEEIRRDERALIRKHTRSALKELSLENRERENKAITDAILKMDEYRNASSIFVFLSLEEEFDTKEIVLDALKTGKKVFVPYCLPETKEIKTVQIHDLENDIEIGHYKIPEPKLSLRREQQSEDIKIDFLIVPGLAFDREGTRLGRGAGYFDRFLPAYKSKSPIICPALSAQIYHYTIPKEAHDIMPDAVVTESEIMRPKVI
ncbi:MAG: 5-formyltetrahydrofolate cyclo-ligase [Fibrobacteres bacterium]|nr:5-formyltetrahydrofolate cyclo-ligase [Fibrobacterota bacterium]